MSKREVAELHDEESAAAGGEEEPREPPKKKTKKQIKAAKENASKKERSMKAMQILLDEDSIDSEENYIWKINQGATCFLNKELWNAMVKHYGWDKKRSKGRGRQPSKKPSLTNGILEKKANGEVRRVGSLVSEYVMSLLSAKHKARAKDMGFVFNGKRSVVAEHDTACKLSFTREHVHKLVMGTVNNMFKEGGTSKFPGVSWFGRDEKWQVQISSPYKWGGRFVTEKAARNKALQMFNERYNKPDMKRFRTYVEIYDDKGRVKPRLVTMKKISGLFKRMRPDIDWD